MPFKLNAMIQQLCSLSNQLNRDSYPKSANKFSMWLWGPLVDGLAVLQMSDPDMIDGTEISDCLKDVCFRTVPRAVWCSHVLASIRICCSIRGHEVALGKGFGVTWFHSFTDNFVAVGFMYRTIKLLSSSKALSSWSYFWALFTIQCGSSP